MSCKAKNGIDDSEEAMTEGETEGVAEGAGGNPFGVGPDADARLRTAQASLDQSATPTPATLNNSVATPQSCKDIPANAPDSYKLGKYFTVASLSSKASLPHTIPNVTAKGLARAHVICNMRHLVTNCLDPLFKYYKGKGYKISVSSGFRNNTNGSDHNVGSAADLIFYKGGTRVVGEDLTKICKEINETLKLPFTQMIHEANKLLHIACRPSGNSNTRLYWSTSHGPVSGVGYRHNV